MRRLTLLLLALCGLMLSAIAQPAQPAQPVPPNYDPQLAQQVGADEHGMHAYVLVILKTGPNKMPAGPARDAMFKGHFANIHRMADMGKLALAGPFGKQEGGQDGWRGMFIFAVPTIDEAKQLVATDPVIQQGEMVAEFHEYYGSAALMLVNEAHARIAKQSF